MSRDWPDLGARTSAHVAQHTTLTIATPQPPAAAMSSHDVYCANSPPIFAVSSAIRVRRLVDARSAGGGAEGAAKRSAPRGDREEGDEADHGQHRACSGVKRSSALSARPPVEPDFTLHFTRIGAHRLGGAWGLR